MAANVTFTICRSSILVVLSARCLAMAPITMASVLSGFIDRSFRSNHLNDLSMNPDKTDAIVIYRIFTRLYFYFLGISKSSLSDINKGQPDVGHNVVQPYTACYIK